MALVGPDYKDKTTHELCIVHMELSRCWLCCSVLVCYSSKHLVTRGGSTRAKLAHLSSDARHFLHLAGETDAQGQLIKEGQIT